MRPQWRWRPCYLLFTMTWLCNVRFLNTKLQPNKSSKDDTNFCQLYGKFCAKSKANFVGFDRSTHNNAFASSPHAADGLRLDTGSARQSSVASSRRQRLAELQQCCWSWWNPMPPRYRPMYARLPGTGSWSGGQPALLCIQLHKLWINYINYSRQCGFFLICGIQTNSPTDWF